MITIMRLIVITLFATLFAWSVPASISYISAARTAKRSCRIAWRLLLVSLACDLALAAVAATFAQSPEVLGTLAVVLAIKILSHPVAIYLLSKEAPDYTTDMLNNLDRREVCSLARRATTAALQGTLNGPEPTR